MGVGYALAWGTQGLALFDFHEVAFALPMVAMVYLRLVDRRHTAAVLWALPVMLVKEDSVFLLLGVVLVLLARRAWRPAAALTGYALVSFGLIVGVVIPRISWRPTGVGTSTTAAQSR